MSSKKNSITNYVQKTLMQFLGGSSNHNTNKNTASNKSASSHKKSATNNTNGKNANATPKKKPSPSKSSTSSTSSSSKKPPPSQSKSSSSSNNNNKLHTKKSVTPSKSTKATPKKPASNKQTVQSTSDSDEESEASEEAESNESEEAEEDEASEESGSEYSSGDDDASDDSHERKNGKASSSQKSSKKPVQSASKKKTPAKNKKVSNSSEEEEESDEEMEESEEEEEEESDESSEVSSPRPIKSQKKSQSFNQKSSNKRKRSSSDEDEEEEEAEEAESDSEKRESKKHSSTSSLHPPPPPPLTSRPLASPPSLALSLHGDDEADIEPDRRQPSKVKHIDQVQIGKYELTTWYYSPYPDPYRDVKKLFLCQYCLKYCKEYKSLVAHMKECQFRRPPGKLIYQDGRNAVFEVDGSVHKLYCQCLCLFAKLFIDHKTLYYDVAPFLFYVLTEVEDPESGSIASPRAGPVPYPTLSASSASNHSYQVVAYFSKEKQSPDQFNLSCILSFPQYQRRGYGKFLIALSYELSRREHRIGSPEKPLSELGKVSYKSYWISELLQLFANQPKYLSAPIVDICNHTSIKKEDLISSLDSIGLIKYKEGDHHISATSKQMKELLHKHHITSKSESSAAAAAAASTSHAHAPLILEFKPSLLHWSPPAHSTSSPSVSFPTSNHSDRDDDAEGERKTSSHVKKKIRY